MASWITEWVWEASAAKRERTFIAVDEDVPKLAGYGTWATVPAVADRDELHLEIAWFGVDTAYQGRCDESGFKVADRIYASVEQLALAAAGHADMPLTLVCHVDNGRGQRFWVRQGYHYLSDPFPRIERDVYYRMVR